MSIWKQRTHVPTPAFAGPSPCAAAEGIAYRNLDPRSGT